jgi:diketogulonate reductase-like aldo/keto reductase
MFIITKSHYKFSRKFLLFVLFVSHMTWTFFGKNVTYTSSQRQRRHFFNPTEVVHTHTPRNRIHQERNRDTKEGNIMASDGCQPMERFSKKNGFNASGSDGSAQKSWASCPSSMRQQQNYPGTHQYSSGGGGGGGYGSSTGGYSVSGYVNGYNPTLPAYPPTRAQIEQMQKNGQQFLPPPGQQFYQGGRKPTAVWDGPAPAGDPNKPKPGTPYYLKTPEESKFDPSVEQESVALGGGANGYRLPMFGCVPKNASKCLKYECVRHVRCGSSKESEDLELAKSAIASSSRPRESLFVSAVLACDEWGKVEESCDAVLSKLGLESLDLFSIEWPMQMDKSVTLGHAWKQMEALVSKGKVKSLGVCNFSVLAVENLVKACEIKPVVNEVELHPMLSQRKLVGVCRRWGLALLSRGSICAGVKEVREHQRLLDASSAADESDPKDINSILTRWSIQRGVAVILDEAKEDSEVEACCKAAKFRLNNAQKVCIDSMEPIAKLQGKHRFMKGPEGFQFDDPFLGGLARPGLEVNPL